MSETAKKILRGAGIGLWLCLCAYGMGKLIIYSNTPGKAALSTPKAFPATSQLSLDHKLANLFIFGHPQCPCSKATIGELERLMPHLQDKIQATVVFVRPDHQSDDWTKKNLWKRAEAIPNVKIVIDEGAKEAKLFDAQTSGQTFLYDGNGNLIFKGGITPSRGHMGDNLGRDAILAFIETGKTSISQTDVFGCSLINPERGIAGEQSP